MAGWSSVGSAGSLGSGSRPGSARSTRLELGLDDTDSATGSGSDSTTARQSGSTAPARMITGVASMKARTGVERSDGLRLQARGCSTGQAAARPGAAVRPGAARATGFSAPRATVQRASADARAGLGASTYASTCRLDLVASTGRARPAPRPSPRRRSRPRPGARRAAPRPGLGVPGGRPLDGGYRGANRLLEGARGRCGGRGRRSASAVGKRRLGRGDRERDGAGHGRGERDLRGLDLGLGLHRVDQSRLEPLQPAARVDRLGDLLGLRLLRLLADRAHDDGLPARRRLTVQLVARVRSFCGALAAALADAEGRGRCDPRSDQRVPLDRRGRDSGRRQPARQHAEAGAVSEVPSADSVCSPARRRPAARCGARASGRTGRSTTPRGAGGRQPCQKGTAIPDPA